MRKLFCYLLSCFLMTSAVQAQDLETIKVVTSATPIKTTTNEYVSVIKIPTLLNVEGRNAKGKQTIGFTLSDSSPFNVNVGGTAVTPGQTIEFKVEANALGGVDIPVYSTSQGVLGSSFFTLYINEVQVLSCPAGFSMSGEMCYKTESYPPYSYECPANYGSNAGGCTRFAPWVEDPNATCPAGYNFYHSYQCIDASGYSEPESSNCYAAGGMWHKWTGSGICHFNSPYITSRARMCSSGYVVNGTCFNPSDTTAPIGNCGSGYYDGSMCSRTYSQPAQ